MKKIISTIMFTVLILVGVVAVNAQTATATVNDDFKLSDVTIRAMESTVGGSCVVASVSRVKGTPDHYKFELMNEEGKVVESYTSGVTGFAFHHLASGTYSARVSVWKDGVEMDASTSKQVYAEYDLPEPPPAVTMWRSYHVKSENGRAIKVELETRGEFKEFKVEYFYKWGLANKVGEFTTTDTEFTLEGLKRGWHVIKITPVLTDGTELRDIYTYSYARLRR